MILQGFNYCLYPRSSQWNVAWKCLQCSSILIWSVGIGSLGVSKLLAADSNSVSSELLDSGSSPSELTETTSPVATPENFQPAKGCFQTSPSDLDPSKSPLKRGTLTEFSPLSKGGWGGSPGLKTHPSPFEDSSVDNTVGLTSPPAPLHPHPNPLLQGEAVKEERSNANANALPLCEEKAPSSALPPHQGDRGGWDGGLGELSLPNTNSTASIELHYPIPPPIQLAAPENFNPGLRLLPPKPQPSIQPSSPPTSTESTTPAIKLESLTTDFRRDADNFDQRNLFIQQTAQFRLRNGNRVRIKTGFNSFEQPNVESVTNIPLNVEWEGKINQVTVAVGGGVDVFDRLPTALNFNAKVEAPFAMKVSPSGQLQSGVVVSANLEQGSYKSNAETLNNQITAWRFGPSLYWQIDPNTSLYSSLRLGSYSDGNFEQQSFSRLERKFGQFSVAANLFNWNYRRNVETTSGYFSPPDFLVYNGEVGWERNIVENLRCRLAASLGQQRLQGEWEIANSYRATCTAKLSPNVEADFGYAYSNPQNRQKEGSGYTNQSFTGQLRVKF